MIHKFHHLKHTRPLIVLDAETTGTDAKTDRVVEVAALKFTPGEKPRQFHTRVNPGRPIPAAATETHGITDADVRDAPAFCQVVERFNRFLNGADLAGFNLKRFDLPLLIAEYQRCGQDFPIAGRSVLDAMEIYHEHEPRDLSAAVQFYCGRDHGHAHAALGDVIATAEVLDSQLGRYSGLPNRPAALHRRYSPLDLFGYLRLEGGQPVLSSGKHRNRPLAEVAANDTAYLRWLLGADFPEDLKHFVSLALRDS